MLKFWGEEVELTKLLLSFPLLLFKEDKEEGRNFCRCFLIVIINVFIIVSLALTLSSSSVAKRSYYHPP
jgi:hypothetical protein